MPKKIIIPEIKFSKWIHWNQRESKIENIDYPGVYMLAKFRGAPQGLGKPTNASIIYFGESADRNLQVRWNEFNNSAFKGKSGHGGGFNYRKEHGDTGRKLYVSAFPVILPEDLSPWFIRYLERKLIWDFIYRYGSQNLLNKK